jgi:hypothetical protein
VESMSGAIVHREGNSVELSDDDTYAVEEGSHGDSVDESEGYNIVMIKNSS